jgi:hypothetical protein
MNRLLRSQFAHYALWALLLLVLVVVRPRPWSPLFLSLFGLAMALGMGLMWRSRREAVASRRAFAAWQARMQLLAPAMDVDDDGHLYEWLEPPQLGGGLLRARENAKRLSQSSSSNGRGRPGEAGVRLGLDVRRKESSYDR